MCAYPYVDVVLDLGVALGSSSGSVPLASRTAGTLLDGICRTSLSDVGVGVRGVSTCCRLLRRSILACSYSLSSDSFSWMVCSSRRRISSVV